MGVSVDRILGFKCNIQDINKDILEKVIDGELENLGIYSSYSKDIEPGQVVVFDDGLSGEYTYLVYIKFFEDDCDDYSGSTERDIYDEVNDYLREIKVPKDIRDTLREKVEKLGLDKCVADNAELILFRHFH